MIGRVSEIDIHALCRARGEIIEAGLDREIERRAVRRTRKAQHKAVLHVIERHAVDFGDHGLAVGIAQSKLAVLDRKLADLDGNRRRGFRFGRRCGRGTFRRQLHIPIAAAVFVGLKENLGVFDIEPRDREAMAEQRPESEAQFETLDARHSRPIGPGRIADRGILDAEPRAMKGKPELDGPFKFHHAAGLPGQGLGDPRAQPVGIEGHQHDFGGQKQHHHQTDRAYRNALDDFPHSSISAAACSSKLNHLNVLRISALSGAVTSIMPLRGCGMMRRRACRWRPCPNSFIGSALGLSPP